MIDRKRRVVGAWDVGFHTIVQKAREQYSRDLNKPNLRDMDVTRIWGEGKLTQFKIPKLKLRRGYKIR
jgi:hypothetical protein